MAAKTIDQLPIPLEQHPINIYQTPDAAPQSAEEGAIPLSHYLWLLRKQAWKIAAFILVSLLATFLISSRLQPIYESTVAVSIDREAPSGVVGSDSQKETATTADADQYISTQMKIMQSDAVLRPVAQQFNLLARERQLDGLSEHRIAVLKNAPTVLKKLRVTRPPNTYLVQISYRSTQPQLSADVANAIAKSYLEHIYRIQIDASTSAAGFMERQLDELKAKMERSGQALAAFEKELNLINPEEKTSIITARLLQLNTEYTTAQSDRVKKEAIYNSMKAGSLAAEQISGQGEDLQKLQDRLNDANEQFAEITATRGPNHPEYRKAQLKLRELATQYQAARGQIAHRIEVDYRQSLNREQMLRSAVQDTKAEFDQINERSFDYQRLKQEADADKKLYEELVTKIREDGINAGFQNKNTAIADYARPASKAVFPNFKLNLLLAGLLATILGIGAIILMDSFDATIRDPEQVNRLFNTDLLGTLPIVRDSKLLLGTSELPSGARLRLSSNEASYANRSFSSFEEAVRMLRNSILLSDLDSRIRSLLLTSATPGEGKSTTAVYLAIAHAQQGKKTLLIDADLRRPTLHKKLGMECESGLSSVLAGECSWKEASIQSDIVPNLHLLPAGPPSRRTTDLLGSKISDILDEATRVYDLVIIDAPPMLGFAEPMQLAIAADAVLVVAIAGETSRKAIRAVMNTLQRLRANIVGLVLNRTSKESGSGYYYYYEYDKYYQAK
jgi:capsular exopolysaccharide synthesis family protein